MALTLTGVTGTCQWASSWEGELSEPAATAVKFGELLDTEAIAKSCESWSSRTILLLSGSTLPLESLESGEKSKTVLWVEGTCISHSSDSGNFPSFKKDCGIEKWGGGDGTRDPVSQCCNSFSACRRSSNAPATMMRSLSRLETTKTLWHLCSSRPVGFYPSIVCSEESRLWSTIQHELFFARWRQSVWLRNEANGSGHWTFGHSGTWPGVNKHKAITWLTW